MCESIFPANNGFENLNAKLLKSRTVLVFGDLDEKNASEIISKLIYLDQEEVAPIKMYINSAGGSETEALAIYDMMNAISSPVHTLCVGKAHGMAALLLAGGERGNRSAYKNSEVMLMQVSRDRTFGQASDIELETAHLLDVKNKINAILAEICGIDAEKVNVDTERKYWLFANEAMEYGLIDRVI